MGAVLTDFSKAIDCIPHDLLIAKLAANGFDLNAFPLIFRNLKKQELSVLINNTHSSLGNIISGVSSWFNCETNMFQFINDLFYIIEKVSIFNFADDNTLPVFSKQSKAFFIFYSRNLKNVSNGSQKIK